MHEFEIINKYFSKLTNKSKGSLNLNDDIFFDKANKIAVSVDTYIEGKHFINFKNPELVIKKVIIEPSRLNFLVKNGEILSVTNKGSKLEVEIKLRENLVSVLESSNILVEETK
mgnify:CR=1 FL=1